MPITEELIRTWNRGELVFKKQSRTHAVLPANRIREDSSCIGQIVLRVSNPLGEVSKPEAFDVGFGGDRCRLSKSHVAVIG